MFKSVVSQIFSRCTAISHNALALLWRRDRKRDFQHPRHKDGKDVIQKTSPPRGPSLIRRRILGKFAVPDVFERYGTPSVMMILFPDKGLRRIRIATAMTMTTILMMVVIKIIICAFACSSVRRKRRETSAFISSLTFKGSRILILCVFELA